MRQLRCLETQGLSVQEVLEDFNDRAHGFGIRDEKDIVSVNVGPPTAPAVKIFDGEESRTATCTVTIVYWSEQ